MSAARRAEPHARESQPPAAPREGEEIYDTLGTLESLGGDGDVSLADIFDALGHSTLAPLLLVPALIVVTPLSGIPGLSSMIGIIIALVSVQMLFGRNHLWLPNLLLRKDVDAARMQRWVKRLHTPARWIDAVTRKRLTWLLVPPFVSVVHLLCLACGLAMPMMEFVPFSSSILGFVVLLVAVGLIARDGLWVFGSLAVLGGGVFALARVFFT
ncbi:exopolysaccharide biosynthesis protein [Tepidamorphus sp. 3E244]|uniref:exopolysaccharide biosynthesis protein n=1 Tax=Tepidamorphus sp. 3E244 TaxID=3385498 RepID=UPI0038FC7487